MTGASVAGNCRKKSLESRVVDCERVIGPPTSVCIPRRMFRDMTGHFSGQSQKSRTSRTTAAKICHPVRTGSSKPAGRQSLHDPPLGGNEQVATADMQICSARGCLCNLTASHDLALPAWAEGQMFDTYTALTVLVVYVATGIALFQAIHASLHFLARRASAGLAAWRGTVAARYNGRVYGLDAD